MDADKFDWLLAYGIALRVMPDERFRGSMRGPVCCLLLFAVFGGDVRGE